MARRREFDEHALLETATDVFWSRGYAATSLSDIAQASGVGTSSIYAAYGSKWGLFLAAFERYCAGRVALVRAAVAVGDGSRRDIAERMLAAIIDDCAGQPDRRGCLMLNSIGELASEHPEVARIGGETTGAMERAVRERLPEDAGADTLAAHLVALSQGLIQMSRLGVSERRLHATARAAVAALPA
ncbi:TetR/AcrR family transcriptional regulator [Leifsonia sp. ZF2019]|uniref:TetR/AcrR family transcriptional regulator n=1 Tax=Leifsonia sp. ZF2019 TaxID=2781978 RepID=UPI001CBB81E9|nr:TetR/AcrR family transcriptional regulator [Leifsonia sp. ZF2019]UAJ79315.1 TetR/AcrR family transcriptional regulator [Leifsonia sp. ZF2019]